MGVSDNRKGEWVAPLPKFKLDVHSLDISRDRSRSKTRRTTGLFRKFLNDTLLMLGRGPGSYHQSL
jgi:hypothetical protein